MRKARRKSEGEKPQALQARRLHGEPCAGADCHAGRGSRRLSPACLDERASTGVFEKTSREREREMQYDIWAETNVVSGNEVISVSVLAQGNMVAITLVSGAGDITDVFKIQLLQ